MKSILGPPIDSRFFFFRKKNENIINPDGKTYTVYYVLETRGGFGIRTTNKVGAIYQKLVFRKRTFQGDNEKQKKKKKNIDHLQSRIRTTFEWLTWICKARLGDRMVLGKESELNYGTVFSSDG